MSDSADEALLARMKDSRGSSAELKLSLLNVRAELPDATIFVFEGDDDRAIYFSWVRFVEPAFRYEPFCCGGKDGVLRLKGAVDRDVGDLANGVFFFIDRDFDDARDAVLDERIYMTEHYSVENYLVDAEVLDELLKIEFHCHSEPAARARVCELFDRMFGKFVEVTVDVNRELHAVRRSRIKLKCPLPKAIGKVVDIQLEDVRRTAVSVAELVQPERPVSAEEYEAARADFDALEPRTRFRGKFAIDFFLRWLELLAKDRREQKTPVFAGLKPDVKVNIARLSLGLLAARSRPPHSFREFLLRILDS